MAQRQGEAAASGASEHWLGSEARNRLAPGPFAAGIPGLRLLLSRPRGDWSEDASAGCEADGPEAGRPMTSNIPLSGRRKALRLYLSVPGGAAQRGASCADLSRYRSEIIAAMDFIVSGI